MNTSRNEALITLDPCLISVNDTWSWTVVLCNSRSEISERVLHKTNFSHETSVTRAVNHIEFVEVFWDSKLNDWASRRRE